MTNQTKCRCEQVPALQLAPIRRGANLAPTSAERPLTPDPYPHVTVTRGESGATQQAALALALAGITDRLLHPVDLGAHAEITH